MNTKVFDRRSKSGLHVAAGNAVKTPGCPGKRTLVYFFHQINQVTTAAFGETAPYSFGGMDAKRCGIVAAVYRARTAKLVADLSKILIEAIGGQHLGDGYSCLDFTEREIIIHLFLQLRNGSFLDITEPLRKG